MNEKPKAGQYLYASCAGEDYGQVLKVGRDANGKDVIDILVYNFNDLIDCNDEEWDNPITYMELPENTPVILRDVQYKMLLENTVPDYIPIKCNTPGNGCYRCTKLFSLRDNRTKL